MGAKKVLGIVRLRLWLVLATIAVLALAATFYFWLARLGPFGHEPPDGYPAVDPERYYTVFVYGTLRYPAVRWLIMGAGGAPRPATLPGYRKQGLDLVEEPDAVASGLVLTVTGKQLRRLDRYERLGIRYQRSTYTLDDGTRAWVYRRVSAWSSTEQTPVNIGWQEACLAIITDDTLFF